MKRYYIDGSSKGLGIGAGIVEVNQFNFMNTHEEHCMHPMASALIAEMFALEKTLELAIKGSETYVFIIIDNHKVNDYFKFIVKNNELHFPLATNDAYVLHIRKRIVEFYQTRADAQLRIRLNNRQDAYTTTFINTAHSLSRNYINKLAPIFTNYDTPLKRCNAKGEINELSHNREYGEHLTDVYVKKESNEVVKDVYISQDEKGYYQAFTYENNQIKDFLVGSKHIVNVFYHPYNNLIESDGIKGKDLIINFHSNLNLYSNVEQSVSYERCPQDIKNKGKWFHDMLDNGKISIH